MLDDLRENALDFPGCLLSNGNGINGQILIPDQNEEDSAAEKRNAILKQMAFYIREADEAHCSRKNSYKNQFHMTDEEFRKKYGKSGWTICDHDLGDYAKDGGNGIKLLDWLVEQGLYYKIHLHTMNPGWEVEK